MRLSRVTLLVLIYVTLDFANPMMPGAFQLVGGSIQTVVGCHGRSAEAPPAAATAAPRHLGSVVLPPPRPSSAGQVIAAPRPSSLFFDTRPEPHASSSSIDDD